MEKTSPKSNDSIFQLLPHICSIENKDLGKYAAAYINGIPVSVLIDSGNTAGNCISWKFAQKLGLSEADIVPVRSTIGTAKKGTQLRVLGRPKKKISMQLGGINAEFKFKPYVIKKLSSNVNIGLSFLEKHRIDQIHSEQALRIQGHTVKLHSSKLSFGVNKLKAQSSKEEKTETITHGYAYLNKAVTIPAKSAIFVKLKIPFLLRQNSKVKSGTIISTNTFPEKYNVLPSRQAVVKVKKGTTYTCILNPNEDDITIPKDVQYGVFEFLPQNKVDNKKFKELAWSDEKICEKFKLKENSVLKTQADVRKAIKLIRKFGDLFSDDANNFGTTDIVEHDIDTGSAKPIKQKCRPFNPQVRKQLDEQLDIWQNRGIIEETTSPWSARLLPVPKKNGKIRWCVDYRQLNSVTKKDSFPLPNSEECLTKMANSKVFSALDGTGAYHVVKINPDDQEKTAFSCHRGQFKFKRMPFGLTNAPATYSRLVQKVLEGLDQTYLTAFLDDISCFTPTLSEHFSTLKSLFRAQRRAGLTLQPEKCQLFKKKIEFLGHVVSQEGIHTNQKHIDAIVTWPLPTNLKEIQNFLGKTGYYRKYVRNYATIAAPLMKLVNKENLKQKTKTFELSDVEKNSFEQLKKELINPPILAFPNFHSDEPFVLDTDWSGDPGAIGAVLSQKQDGVERVICYGGRKLRKSERNYSSNKGELLAVIHFINLWKFYLWPRKFILRTDHNALRWIYSMEAPKAMTIRWLDTLAKNNFIVQHREGKAHANADALSRAKHYNSEFTYKDVHDDENVALQQITIEPFELSEISENDPLTTVRQWFELGKGRRNEWKNKGRELLKYYDLFELLTMRNDKIYLKWKDEMGCDILRLCVPLEQQTRLITKTHKLGHIGGRKVAETLAKRYFFPNMIKLSKDCAAACGSCQQKRGKPKEQKQVLKSVLTGERWQRLSIDLVGPMTPSSRGNTYLLTVKDCFSKWLEAFPIADITAKSVADTLEYNIFARYGMPETIHSDQGRQFVSAALKQVYDKLGIQRTTTPAYNPKSNPVERCHRDLKACLTALAMEGHGDWEDNLPAALLALRSAKHDSTGVSPFYAMYGQEARLPIDIAMGLPETQEEEEETSASDANSRELEKRLRKAFHFVRNNMKRAVQRNEDYYGKGTKTFKVGQKVWVFTPKLNVAKGSKFSDKWTGPWLISEKLNEVMFIVTPIGNWSKKQLALPINIDRLHAFKEEWTEETTEKMPATTTADFILTEEFQEEEHQPEEEKPRHGYMTRSKAEQVNWNELALAADANWIRPKITTNSKQEEINKEAIDAENNMKDAEGKDVEMEDKGTQDVAKTKINKKESALAKASRFLLEDNTTQKTRNSKLNQSSKQVSDSLPPAIRQYTDRRSGIYKNLDKDLDTKDWRKEDMAKHRARQRELKLDAARGLDPNLTFSDSSESEHSPIKKISQQKLTKK